MSDKKARVMEVIEEILNLLPPQHKMMLSMLLPSFRPSLENIPEEDIDNLITRIREKLAYIEGAENA
ncbi:MAG: hypothetical protein IJW78_04845 [Clostridia bacterium]|nr:hypothetical protein [Clostridia bacterium]